MKRTIGYAIIDLIYLIRNFQLKNGFTIWRKLKFGNSQIITIKTKFFKNNVFLRRNDSDPSIFKQVFAEHQYNWPESNTLTPKVILDLGSNIGLSALFFAEKYPLANIYAVEPDSQSFELLDKNTKNYPNIHKLKAGAWYKDDALVIEKEEGRSASVVLQKDEKATQKIPVYSIDSLMRQFELSEIDIIKIDIEGAEKEIFELGNLGWLSKTKILVIELHDITKPGCASAFFNALHAKFDKLYIQGENIVCFLQNK